MVEQIAKLGFNWEEDIQVVIRTNGIDRSFVSQYYHNINFDFYLCNVRDEEPKLYDFVSDIKDGLGNIRLACSVEREKEGLYNFHWRLESNAYQPSAREIAAIDKWMKKIKKAIERKEQSEGRAASLGHFISQVMRGLGIATAFTPKIWDYGTTTYARWRTNEVVNAVNNIINYEKTVVA